MPEHAPAEGRMLSPVQLLASGEKRGRKIGRKCAVADAGDAEPCSDVGELGRVPARNLAGLFLCLAGRSVSRSEES